MLLQSFTVKNYRGFRDEQFVSLAPLTLLYGENSTGKSALLRLLPLISESMADRRPGPVLDGVVGREALWSDLAHIGAPAHPITLNISWSKGHQATWEMRGGKLPGSCELKSLSLCDQTKTWALEDDGDGKWQGRIPAVEGMLPSAEADWKNNIDTPRKDFHLDVQWLQGTRASVPRVENALASPPGNLSTRGEGVARFLYHWERLAQSESESKALNYVQSFFEALGFEIRTNDVAPGFFRIDVASSAHPSSSINLVDTGEGLTQVLAPLVAMARAAFGLGPNLVCLEQPELHLHTDAQRALALCIADAAAAGAQIIIETHSEVLLAAVQLAIAGKPSRIENKSVALYWVEKRGDSVSVARKAHLDSHGQVSGGWPMNAFGDLLQIKGDLLDAQGALQ